MSEKKMTVRRLWTACALAMGLFVAPLAFAGNTSQCDSIQDPMQRAQCRCTASMTTYNDQTAGIIPQLADNNPYLKEVATAEPGDNASLKVPGVSKSCNGMTKSVFDSALNSFGGFLGFDVTALLGPVASAAEGTICGSINKAITKRTSIACPKVSIPGFPINCTANLSVNANGVQVTGGGNVGGANVSGSGGTDLSGTTTANGRYGAGAQGGSVSTTIPGPTGGGGIVNNVSCWITGNCN